MAWYPGCPTYSERYPSRADYEGCKRLLEWYGAKFPALRVQWEQRMRQHEEALRLL